MSTPWKRLGAALAIGLSVGAAIAAPAAQEPLQPNPPFRYQHYHVNHVVNADASSIETVSWSIQVLQPQALEWVKQGSVAFSARVQSAEVIEAYTRKADGKRIDVPESGRTTGQAMAPAAESRSVLSVAFPELAVGDTVVFAYRITQREATFPGHFDTGAIFSKQLAYDDVKISVDYPATLPAQFGEREMQRTEPAAAPGRRLVQWQWSNPKPVRLDRRDYSVVDLDQEVGFDFSTFPSYTALASAYGARAQPKAAVTEKVKKLAQEIVAQRQGAAEQAGALYEWVATKIRVTAGECLSPGAVVPRELAEVLDSQAGDCKDHATLLQALLSARGIASQQVLVNAGTVYTLPRIPRAGSVNHIINHIPSLQLYLDSTADAAPFGWLPRPLRGKPALLVGGGPAPVTLPVPRMAQEQHAVTHWKIRADGSMSGTVDVRYQGDAAVTMRQDLRQFNAEQRATLVKDMLRSMGLSGDGRLDTDDTAALGDSFYAKLTLDKVEKFVAMPGGGPLSLVPFIGGASIHQLVGPATGEPLDHPSVCRSGLSTEDYTVELPMQMKVESLPKDAAFTNPLQRYAATYAVKGNVIHARRELEDRTPTAVCAPATVADNRKLESQVHANLQAPVVVK